MKTLFLCTVLSVLSFHLFAQSPQLFQYQAVVRDAGGNAVTNQNVGFQISLISGSITGTVEYVETHTSATNAFGIVTLTIGSGNVVTGTFSNIAWGSNSYFIKVEADPNGGTSYLDMGTTQLLSVPYALYSEQAGNIPTYLGGTGINVSGTTITNTAPDQTVSLTQGGATTISGTYPNFTISSTDLNTGTPGGQNTSIQYNNAGVFAGDTAAMVWDNANKRLGVGISNPTGRVVIKGSSTAPANEPLFEIKNALGQQIMGVYNDSIHFFISDIGANRGGFAVSGRNNAKAMTNDYLRINADSTRIYTGDTIKGFGVKNIGQTSKTSYMQLTPDNYRIGHEAGKFISTGKYNSFFGYQSGYNNTSGFKNYFIGYRSGYSNQTGQSNIFLGDSSGFFNVSGHLNVFIGDNAGMNNTASYNTGLGCYTLYYNNSGSNNTATGAFALSGNDWGQANSAFGANALAGNVSGSNNVAVGRYALAGNTSANDNTAVGFQSLYLNQTGNYNTAVGSNALFLNLEGGNNTAMGRFAMYSNTYASHNVAIGHYALTSQSYQNSSTPWSTYNVAVGGYALRMNNPNSNANGCQNSALGYYALNSNTRGYLNSALGYYAFYAGTLYFNSTALGANSVINASDKVRIGDATVTTIEGQVAYTFPSDGRFKNNVTEEVKGLEFITKLRPVVYNFDTRKFDEFLMANMPDSVKNEIMSKKDYSVSTGIRQTGFIAQEIEQAAKESGYDFNGLHKPADEGDNYSVAYSLFTVPLVKAVQEQQKEIEELKEEIEKLKSLIKLQDK